MFSVALGTMMRKRGVLPFFILLIGDKGDEELYLHFIGALHRAINELLESVIPNADNEARASLRERIVAKYLWKM
jgi:hypothetical protein